MEFLIAVVIGIAVLLIGFVSGRAKPLGDRPDRHRLLIMLLGVSLLAWPVVVAHVMWQVWPVMEEIAVAGTEDVAESEVSVMGELGEDAEGTESGGDEENGDDAGNREGETGENSDDDGADGNHDDDDDDGDGGIPAAGDGVDRWQITLVNTDLNVTAGQAYILVVAVFGAAGAFIHSATSYATYLGNRKFKVSWAWWYAFRPLIGVGVALVLVFAILGGLIALTSQATAVEPGSLNPYTVAAFAALAGWFSKLAADKLEEIFTTALSSGADDHRADKLGATTPVIDSAVIRPTKDGRFELRLTGTNLSEDSTVRLGGVEHKGQLVDDVLVVMLSAAPTDLNVTAVNHAASESDVIEAVNLAPPIVTEATADKQDDDGYIVTIKGTGFGPEPTVAIDGTVVDVTAGEHGALTATVPDVREGSMVVVTTADGVAADPFRLAIS